MATVILYPNGDGTLTSWTANGGSTKWDLIDEGTASPNDSDYLSASSQNVSGFVQLTNPPSNLDTVTGVTIKFRSATGKTGDYIPWDYVQIVAANETDLITSSVAATSGNTITTYSYVPTTIYETGKSAWDGARLKFRTGTGSSSTARVYAVQVELTYTETSGSTFDESMSGGCSVGGAALAGKVYSVTASGGFSQLGSYSPSSLLTGLISHWSLNESSGTRYDNHSFHDLTATNNPTSTTGKFGDGVVFSSASNQSLTCSDNPDLNLGGSDFSFAFWVNFSSLSNNGGNDYIGVFSKGAGANYCFSCQYRPSASFMQVQLNNGTTTGNFGASTFGALSTGVWYFVCFTYNNTSKAVTISVNGVENSYTSATTPTDVSYQLAIGRAYNTNTYNSSCTVDSVSLWRKVLTSTEKAVLYRNGTGYNYQFDLQPLPFIASGGVSAGGLADDDFISEHLATGGAATGGQALYYLTLSELASGGVLAGGAAILDPQTFNELGTGGATAGGEAIVYGPEWGKAVSDTGLVIPNEGEIRLLQTMFTCLFETEDLVCHLFTNLPNEEALKTATPETFVELTGHGYEPVILEYGGVYADPDKAVAGFGDVYFGFDSFATIQGYWIEGSESGIVYFCELTGTVNVSSPDWLTITPLVTFRSFNNL